MSNKAISVYADAMKRQAEEEKKKPASQKPGRPDSRKSRKRPAHRATQGPARGARQKARKKPKRESGKPAGSKTKSPDTQKGGGAEVALQGQMEAVRRVVREVGKERADVGLTPGEKETLREIAFTRTQAGRRTTINDVVRVALNWLLEDYRARKEKSLLSRTLDAVQS